MPDAAPAKLQPKKCAPFPGTKSDGFAFLPRTRCIASLHGWKSVVFRKPEASAATRRPPVPDLLQKKKAASSPREHSGRRFNLYGDTRRHDSFSPSGSNFSATSLPSAFFNRISTLPSASSSCFWHSRESATPSSNNFIASSSESCGLSSLRTTSSSRANDRSKSGFFCGSGFFGAGMFTRPFHLAPGSRSAQQFHSARIPSRQSLSAFYATGLNRNNCFVPTSRYFTASASAYAFSPRSPPHH